MWTVSMLEITIEERAESERSGGYVPIPPLGTLQPGKGHRFSHFHSHPGCPGGGRFHQPQAGSLTQRQELGLSVVGGFGFTVERPGRVGLMSRAGSGMRVVR